jgi:type IV pilus assembly protein PilA
VKIKRKAFTLIELLVVVAIIGILAAVGVVAYNGYTKSAKTTAVKINEKTVIKFIQTILQRCEIDGDQIQLEGVTTPNGGKINCSLNNSSINISQIITVFQNYFQPKLGKNLFDNNKEAIIVSGQNQVEGAISLDVGFGDRGQCNSNITNKNPTPGINCINVITWLTAYPNNRNDVSLFFSHWPR